MDNGILQCSFAFCTQRFDSRLALEKHTKQHNNGKAAPMLPQNEPSVKCEHCSEYFQNQTSLNLHITQKHIPIGRSLITKKYVTYKTCRMCCEKISEAFWSKHLDQVHPFSCRTCYIEKGSEEQLIAHLSQKHSTRHQCKVCWKLFINQELLRTHNHVFKCKHCAKTFAEMDELVLHTRKDHTLARPSEGLKCSKCNKYFKNKDFLNLHEKQMHPSVAEFAPKLCKDRDQEDDSIPESTTFQGDSKRIRCRICNESFERSQVLSHFELKHAECVPENEKTLNPQTQKIDCQDDQKAKNVQKLVRCKLCEISFPSTQIFSHFKSKHPTESVYSKLKETPREPSQEIGKYECDQCSKDFESFHELEIHKKVHIVTEVEPKFLRASPVVKDLKTYNRIQKSGALLMKDKPCSIVTINIENPSFVDENDPMIESSMVTLPDSRTTNIKIETGVELEEFSGYEGHRLALSEKTPSKHDESAIQDITLPTNTNFEIKVEPSWEDCEHGLLPDSNEMVYHPSDYCKSSIKTESNDNDMDFTIKEEPCEIPAGLQDSNFHKSNINLTIKEEPIDQHEEHQEDMVAVSESSMTCTTPKHIKIEVESQPTKLSIKRPLHDGSKTITTTPKCIKLNLAPKKTILEKSTLNKSVVYGASSPAKQTEAKIFTLSYEDPELKRTSFSSAEIINCKICNKKFTNKTALLNHFALNHSHVTCEVCQANMKSSKLLIDHLEREHSIKYECEDCKQTFTTRKIFDIHRRTHKIKCADCNVTFNGRDAHRVHSLNKSSTVSETPKRLGIVKRPRITGPYLKTTPENMCSEALPLEYELDYFELKRTACSGAEIINCKICNEKFTNKKTLLHHFSQNHTQVKCDFCHTYLKSDELLTEHLFSVHSIKFECEDCKQLFTTQKIFDIHRRTHKIKCEDCNIIFNGRDAKNAHDAKAHRKPYETTKLFNPAKKSICTVYKCQFCETSFFSQISCERHFYNEHWIKCDQCFRIFRSKVLLDDHKQKKHSTKKTLDKSVLKKPKVTPCPQYRFDCGQCDAFYDNMTMLGAHMKMHGKIASKVEKKQTETLIEDIIEISKYECHKCKMVFESFHELEYHGKTHIEVSADSHKADSNSASYLQEIKLEPKLEPEDDPGDVQEKCDF